MDHLKLEPFMRKLLLMIPAVHILIWVLLPSLLEGSLRLDAAEGMTGGPEWQLSYPKHPPLSEWLVAVAWYAGPLRYSALYLLSQCLAAGSIFLVSRWALKYLGVGPACLALLAGLASPFATYIPVQLNHNIGVMPFWALALICAWASFNTNRILVWALFGLVVGFGFWAKYSILHLVAPLALLFVFVPEWRQRLFGAGPWIAALIALMISLPHFLDVWAKGASTFKHALHPTHLSPREVAGFAFNMFLNAALLILFTAIPFIFAVGIKPFFRAFMKSLNPKTASQKDLFLTVASLGPLLLVIISPVFGIRPRPLWVTPMIVPVSLWLANIVSHADKINLKRSFLVTGFLSAMLIIGYASAILVPIQNKKAQYSNLDHQKILRDARQYWRENGNGRIIYIVTTQTQRSMHAAGSIAFDLPYRVHVFEQADKRLSPWIRPNDVTRRGALVIGSPDIPEDFRVNGVAVSNKKSYETPTIRGRKRYPITYGLIEPQK